MAKQAEAHLRSASPFSFSKFYQVERLPDELHDAYEARTWRERCHYDREGKLFIPPMAFKKALAAAAKFKSKRIPGEGKATWTKHFLAGVLVLEGMGLPITKDAVEGEWIHVPPDGKPGGTSRVLKCFPVIREWEGRVIFEILDDKITEEVFRLTLADAGKFVGVGRFRPERGGFYGRFIVEEVVWVQ